MTRVLYLLIALMITLSSCTSDKSKEAAGVYVERISRNLAKSDKDSLLKIRDELSQEENDELRSQVFIQTADSSMKLRAMALVLTHSPENVADTVLKYPSTDFATEIHHSYHMLNISNDYKKVTVHTQEKFDALTPDQQALIVVAYMSAEEIAAAIEPGDEALVSAVRKIYNRNPEELTRFNNALSNKQQ